MKRRIFITSFPYVYERYFKMFDLFEHKDRLFFILPNNWQVKRKGRYAPVPKRDDIRIKTTRAYFWHSHYPIIGGVMKCWMPGIVPILMRYAQRGDVLYTATEPSQLSTLFNGLAARLLGLRHIIYTDQNVSYQDRISLPRRWIVELILKVNIALSEKIVCSNKKALELHQGYSNNAKKFENIPQTGIDTKIFRPRTLASRQENGHEQKVVFAFAGMLEPRKGIRELVHAFADAHRRHPRISLLLIGFGPEQQFVQEYAARNMLQDAISILGFVSNNQLAELFRSIDVFVCNSLPTKGWEEQLGYSMREAAASGVPIISTATGSIDEIVIQNKTGILVPPRNHAALVGAFERLTDGALRSEMGRAGREHALRNFSYEVIVQKTEVFFEKVLST